MPDKITLRTFGIIWALIFFLVGYSNQINTALLAISLGFLLVSIFYPNVFFKTHIFQIWVKFGNFIGKINSKIIIFILFFFIFVPIGLVLKIIGKDLLNKKLNKEVDSYFAPRKTEISSMINQF